MNILQLFQIIKPNVKKATLEQYVIKLNKIYNSDNADFVFNPVQVIKFLDQYKSTNTKRSYLSPVIIILRYYVDLELLKEKEALINGIEYIKSEKAINRASTLDIFEKLNNEYKNNYEDNRNIKTVNEAKNWLDWNEILKVRDSYIKTLDSSFIKDQSFLKNRKEDMILENALISSLFTFLEPSRLDYNNMTVYKNKEKSELPTDKNYLLINKKETMKIILNSYKTEKKNKPTIKIIKNPTLKRIIKLYIKFNKNILEGVTENSLSKKIKILFNGANMNILRHSYLSAHVNLEELNKNEKIANAMMHSTAQQKKYIKI